MTQFEKDVFTTVSETPGIKARDIAKKLGVERNQVNSALYGALKSRCYQDSSYNWFVKGAQVSTATDMEVSTPTPDKSLSDLCRYYLNCLSLEESNGISAYLTSKYGNLGYTELNQLDFDDSSDAVNRLLQRTSRERNLAAYVGYPVMIEKFYSSKSNQDIFKIAPVFLFAVDNEAGATHIASIPSINMEVIKQYSSRDVNTQVYDLVELETELGLNSSEADIEIDEMVARLQAIRQWQWRDALDPHNIDNSYPVGELTEEGIYNRAILIVAERSPYTIGLESELSQLATIDENTYKDTALYKWIHKTNQNNKNGIGDTVDNLLEVLPLNTEQEEAIQNALIEDLTIVTGPPGTGKSQVVTDLLVNIAWRGKNALFASKNNKAVDVVDTRVNSLGRRPIMLRLGTNHYGYRLAELISDLLSYTADESDRAEYTQYKDSYQKQNAAYLDVMKKKDIAVSFRNQADHIEQRFCLIRERWGSWLGQVDDNDTEAFTHAFSEFVLGYNGTQKHKQSILTRLFWFIVSKSRIENAQSKGDALNKHLAKYGLKQLPAQISQLEEQQCVKVSEEVRNSIDALQTLSEYELVLKELGRAESLESIDKQLYELKSTLADVAGKLWKKWLVTRPLQINAQQRTEMNQYVTAMKLVGDVDLSDYPELRQQFKKLQKDMTGFLPCWAVTSLSAKGRIPFQPGIFDLVIIDEASQCDIASVLPLLYRAKRAVIIGDPKQLSHISSISKAQDLNLLQKYSVSFDWSYSANSLYAFASGISDSSNIIQLRDHHRSFGEIIEFSNQEFYDGKLRVATNYERLNCPRNVPAGIRWIDVAGQTVRPASGGAYNDIEVKAILNELKRLVIDNNYRGSVGVVTPFRAQADRIRDAIEKVSELKNYLYAKNDFQVDTVHKFQGDERDIMIFSPVISAGTKDGAISFLNNTGNLFNVAITRARSVLVVVGDMNYCAGCKVTYMEHFVDYVRKRDERAAAVATEHQSESYGSEYPKVSNADQVSDWEKIFYSALYEAGVRTSPQYPVDKYKLDLALFSGERRLDIEIDGEMYHKDWNGELCYRDQLRNHRLFEIGWDVKRFWVYQIRDELPRCILQVKEWINKISV